MRTLFIYYSHTGSGDIVADHLRQKGADVRQIRRKKPLPRSFVASVLTGGFLAGIGHKDKLQAWDSATDGYDRIVIGSPVWNGRLSCPINTVLTHLDTDKPLAFVLYSGSGEAPKALARIAKHYPTAKAVVLQEPKKYPDQLIKLDQLF